jgi:predicted TIM-barrel fold metal-dependent hydrolase
MPEYPFPGAQGMFRRLRDEIAIHKPMWGTDMPYCSGPWCAYKRALDYVRVNREFLSADEKAPILRDNALHMFGRS